MANTSEIREHMEVVGSDGEHVGTVDKVEIKLTKDDPQARGQHHYISVETVDSIEEDAVWLNLTGEQARQQAMGDSM